MSATSALWRLCVSLLFSTSLSCYQCLDDLNLGLRLCWGHMLTEQGIRNVGACFRKLDRIFNNNERVIEAGRVGEAQSYLLYMIFFKTHFLQDIFFKNKIINQLSHVNPISDGMCSCTQLAYACVKCAPVPGKGYDKQLKELLEAEILPMAEEFDKKENDGNRTAALIDTKQQVNESLERQNF